LSERVAKEDEQMISPFVKPNLQGEQTQFVFCVVAGVALVLVAEASYGASVDERQSYPQV
jgi:hypothetical protein